MTGIGLSLRRFIVNLICGFVYNENTRRRVRVTLNSPVFELCRFIKKDCGVRHPRFKIMTGFRACNLCIKVDEKYIYKYPTMKEGLGKNAEIRERDITTELAKVSPIFIPTPTLLKYEDKYLRRYDVVSGISLRQLIRRGKVYQDYKKYLAHQVAYFLYVIAKSNPAKLNKYKLPADKNKTPDFMYGWHHCDLLDNFFIDPKTFKITAFIDWEEVAFGDFSKDFHDKDPILNDFMKTIKTEYAKIYNK